MLVLVDQDGPLADFEAGFCSRWSEKYPDRPVVPTEQRRSFYIKDEYPAEYREDIMEIQSSPGFILGLPLIPGALDALHGMEAEGDEVRILTSPLTRYHNCVMEKYAWVDRHLGPDWVRRIILTKDKTMVRGDVLIDDKPEITGYFIPVWEHLVFDAAYNVDSLSRRISWTDWRQVLRQIKIARGTTGMSWRGTVGRMVEQAEQSQQEPHAPRHWYGSPQGRGGRIGGPV
jgi:5'-nucleotidase